MIKLAFIELRLFFRAPIATFFTIIFPLLYLLLIMEVLIEKDDFRNLANEDGFYAFSAIDYVTPSIMILILTTTAIMGIPSLLVNYREMAYFKRLLATSLTPFKILASLLMSYLTITFLSILLVLLAGNVVYKLNFNGNAILSWISLFENERFSFLF